MKKGWRTAIGVITAFVPPFPGLWLWYLWWAEQDEWDYQSKLLAWMEGANREGTLSGYEGAITAAKWDTPYGSMILWNRGDVSLHKDDDCLMCSFGGGCLGSARLKRLRGLCEESLQRKPE